jgi:hypothetical protein
LQNIDPLYFATPLVVLALMVGLLVYWRKMRSLTGNVMLYSLIAYAGAIALKYAVQIPTYGAFESSTGGSHLALGIYYGVQTAAFEVGGAYVVARLALARSRLRPEDAGGFGLGLAFWENVGVFAVPVLLDYAVYYATLSSPGSSAAQTLYPVLSRASPGLFYSPAAALPLIGYAILERVSSLIAHFSWGLLCVLGAAHRKPGLVLAALPIGFAIDFLVPFAPSLGLGVFELALFVISLVALAGALALTKPYRPAGPAGVPGSAPASNT